MPPRPLLAQLRRALQPFLAAQIVARGPAHGAYCNPEWGLPDPSHGGTGALLAGCSWLSRMGSRAERAWLRRRAEFAAAYLLRAQRPTGRIDLVSCNFDSAPDTAFVVQLLCAVTELLRFPADPADAPLLDSVAQFVARAAPGLATGGFHTPNHRWVIASALAWSQALWPQLDANATIAAYCAEGIDQDRDGAYQERSIGIYDSVTNRSLWLLARHARWANARHAVRRNLQLDLALLHADGSAESALSRRQDRAQRLTPSSLAPALILAGQTAAGSWLWSRARRPTLSDCLWMAHALGHADAAAAPSRTDFHLPDVNQWFPRLGLWRLRRGALSVSIFRDSPQWLHVVFGRAELQALHISQSYFGVGRFKAETVRRWRDGVTLHSSGMSDSLRRPGYDLPLAVRVPIEQWDEIAAQREVRRLPPAASTVTVQPTARGLELRYRTLRGLAGVPAQMAFDFAPGGQWHAAGRVRRPSAGEVLFLDRGVGEMRYGHDIIRLSPGAQAHAMLAMRDTPSAPGAVRVLITFLTPVDHVLRLELSRTK